MTSESVILSSPEWLQPMLASWLPRGSSAEQRMRFVIGLARRNIAQGGGPFAAAVFESASGQLIAAGVNRVLADRTSIAHAEIIALAAAQQRLDNCDLGAPGLPRCELVCTCEPCAMCLGALLWSGVAAIRCGARGEDAEAIGFDEGPKPADWVGEFERRGIAVTRDLCRAEAAGVLRDYGSGGGIIYNPGRPVGVER